MKLRKLLALLMAASILLGMVPAVHAEGGNMLPGGELAVSCDHNWAWRWPNGQPANCQDWKISVEYCTKCGAENGSFEQCGPCQPGSWYWDGNPPANCNEWGIQNQTCSVCGEVFNEREARGDHQWSGFTAVEPAGCETPGEEVSNCSVCGERGSSRETPALGHNWGDWKWEIEATCNQDGLRVRYCKRCNMRDEDYVQGGSHSFGSWVVTQAATCFRVGKETRTCVRCGITENRDTGYGPHQYGPWGTVQEPTCMAEGKRQSTCTVCGVISTNTTDKVDHNFGEWYVVAEAQVGLPGLEQRDCTYGCGTYEQREIPPLDEGDNVPPVVELPTVILEKHVMNAPANGEFFVPGEAIEFGFTLWVYGPGKTKASSEFIVKEAIIYDPLKEDQIVMADIEGTWNMGHAFLYTVTEEDARRGYVENTGYATWIYVENGQPGRVDSNTVTTPCGPGTLSAEGLNLSLVLSSTPANGSHFVVGEEVTFTETWSNGTGKTLDPFSVSIFTCAAPLFGSEIDQICSWFAEDSGGPVAPGASGSHTLTVTVTEADVARGAIYAMAELLSTVQNGPDLENVTTPFVTAPCGPDNSGDFGLVNGLTVTKQVTSTPANGSYYVPGETVTYEVCVKNNGEPLNMLCVSDWMQDGTFKYGTIETGEDVTYPISYTVIELDAISGSVSNISFAEAVAANGDPVLEYSNSVTVPCGFPEGDDPFGIFHSVAVVKTEESLPMNGEFYTVGEVIHYAITYTNDGELPLTDVQVWDVMNVTAPIASAEMLQPGESRTCYYQHTVTPEDVASGSVMNVAHASYPVPNAAGFANSCSNVVISKTDAYDWVWVTPLFPESGEDPEYDPGTGWFPDGDPIPEGETPPFGTIDTDTLHGGDSYCMRTITGRDNVSASYETTFCAVHSPVQSSVLMMSQAAVTPEMQVQSAAYAAALWRSEAEALYQQIIGAADPTATAVVMTEFVRFMTEVANYEVLLKGLYPDQPALVATKVAAMWENKCIDLCCEMHAAAAERKDSLLAVSPANGAVAEKCACELTAQEAGKETSVQRYCPVHGFPFSMIDALLQGSDTAEAWTMVRQIWGVELTNSYNKVYTALGDNKLLAMAEYNALTQWMMAREATLIALYPSHPEVVAQTMVKIIMDRVNDLCQAIQ